MSYLPSHLKQSIAVWSINLPDHQEQTPTYLDGLSQDERQRAEKFLKPADANRFILCRGLLRQILADYLNCHPSTLKFERTEQGKPFLRSQELDFNISHSCDRLLIAVTSGSAVGIDIEFKRENMNITGIAKRWFSGPEQAFLQTLSQPVDGFFEIWAKKEAYSKAVGCGIYNELSRFSVPLGEPPGSPILGSDGQWFFQSLTIDSAYAAAVVSVAPPVPVNVHTL
ncbi:MAG: 4'-phosphopantetheinyl transferase superfamily protein [Kiritimatiellaceae bacterium]|nr:4'-phosphopantetheinyl transferase superfamily protein [Kiritimatiellaceae bacterium]